MSLCQRQNRTTPPNAEPREPARGECAFGRGSFLDGCCSSALVMMCGGDRQEASDEDTLFRRSVFMTQEDGESVHTLTVEGDECVGKLFNGPTDIKMAPGINKQLTKFKPEYPSSVLSQWHFRRVALTKTRAILLDHPGFFFFFCFFFWGDAQRLLMQLLAGVVAMVVLIALAVLPSSVNSATAPALRAPAACSETRQGSRQCPSKEHPNVRSTDVGRHLRKPRKR